MTSAERGIWAPLQYKDIIFMYKDPHVKDKTVAWPSYH